jgi:bromodomain-containing factor 1
MRADVRCRRPQNGEEIELDIDALPPATIVRLYNLVVRGLTTPRRPKGKKPGRRPGPQGPHNGGSGGSRKKVNDEHEAERIRRMEQQLARFDGGPAGGGGVAGEDDGEDDGESAWGRDRATTGGQLIYGVSIVDDEDESGSESE